MGERTNMDRAGVTSETFIRYGSLYSALGNNLNQAWEKLLLNESGIKTIDDKPEGCIVNVAKINRFNSLFHKILQEIKVKEAGIVNSNRTQIIISSAKADIDQLPHNAFEQMQKDIVKELGLEQVPIIISNACISGILAINLGADLIRYGNCDQALIIGIDVLSDFVRNGFKSLFALSDQVCKPYDKERKGINLGEAAAYMVLSNKTDQQYYWAKYLGGSSSNDANHISGPSRTGEGLYRSIAKTLKRANIAISEIDYISAHGTATLYNDEMEGITFNRLNLDSVPTNSFKAYVGHTLGAAGLVETILALKTLEENMLIKSLGYQEHGLTKSLNIIQNNTPQVLNCLLKTGSGFGGGNASLILQKISRH